MLSFLRSSDGSVGPSLWVWLVRRPRHGIARDAHLFPALDLRHVAAMNHDLHSAVLQAFKGSHNLRDDFRRHRFVGLAQRSYGVAHPLASVLLFGCSQTNRTLFRSERRKTELLITFFLERAHARYLLRQANGSPL